MTVSNPPLENEVESDNDTTDSPAIEMSDVLTAISNKRRRFVIHRLKRANSPVTIDGMATQLAAWELEKPTSAVSSSERKNMYNALAQTHVRRLAECNFIVERDGGIELTAEAKRTRLQLDIAPDQDIPWSRYYLLLGAFYLAVSVAVLVASPSLGMVPVGALGLVVAVSIFIPAFAHRYHKRQMSIGEGERPPETQHEL